MGNDEERRPEPESLLELSREEEGKDRGKLTIYFGAAPGVGKTYSMLSDARLKKRDGVDVLVGYYEAHARPETEALLEGQEIIPPRKIEYRGMALKEMDLEAILKRKPALVLVDELAHTNAPESRHVKRYQDVEELLDAGIDVYATLNVQHLESVSDLIFQIAGIRVQEKIPDTIFQSADEVKLVDLPYEELLQRLNEGKVYVKGMAEEALRRFFQPSNLLALRQMAMRLSAGRVDERMRIYMRAHAIAGPWPISERILVSVYASPYAERLVRSTFRLASEMNAEWAAIYVEGPEHARLSDEEKRWLENAMDIARKLGAQIVWTKGDDPADEISRYAQNNNVTKIVMGKPGRLWFFPTIVRKIMYRTRNIDIFLFASEGKDEVRPIRAKRRRGFKLRNYLLGLLSVAIVSGIGFMLRDVIGEMNILFMMLLPVIWTAIYLGRGASIITALASIVAFDFLFVHPYYTFTVHEIGDMISFSVYLIVAVVISNLASKLRYRVGLLAQSESRSVALCDASRHLVTARNVDQVLSLLINRVKAILPCEVAILLPSGAQLSVEAATPEFKIDQKELSVATWVWLNGKNAGQATETLPQAWAHYLPMRTSDGIKGVLGVHLDDPKEFLTPENDAVLDALAGLGATAIERIG